VFAGTKTAIDRALKVNGCTNNTYDSAVAAGALQDFPIGSNNADSTCKQLTGCPALYPLVVCALPGNQHGTHDSIVNPGFSTFLLGLEP